MENMRKITISIDPPKAMEQALKFIDITKSSVDSFLSRGEYAKDIGDGDIEIRWYDDFPTSCGVALTISFRVLRGVDLAGELIIALRKDGYDIRGTAIGY